MMLEVRPPPPRVSRNYAEPLFLYGLLSTLSQGFDLAVTQPSRSVATMLTDNYMDGFLGTGTSDGHKSKRGIDMGLNSRNQSDSGVKLAPHLGRISNSRSIKTPLLEPSQILPQQRHESQRDMLIQVWHPTFFRPNLP